jgi:hypothetical protein
MKWLLLMAALPLAAFMIAYSIDAGCFICLCGEGRGGVVEKGSTPVSSQQLSPQ